MFRNGQIISAVEFNSIVSQINSLTDTVEAPKPVAPVEHSLPVAAITAGLLLAGSERRRVSRRSFLGFNLFK